MSNFHPLQAHLASFLITDLNAYTSQHRRGRDDIGSLPSHVSMQQGSGDHH